MALPNAKCPASRSQQDEVTNTPVQLGRGTSHAKMQLYGVIEA